MWPPILFLIHTACGLWFKYNSGIQQQGLDKKRDPHLPRMLGKSPRLMALRWGEIQDEQVLRMKQ
jgi:hypothetical protein